ncbi:MAG: amidohydrolase family protein [Bradyrhizobium sp.]
MPDKVHARTPRLQVPPGACDTHMHFYSKAYPASSKAWLFPPDSTVEDYCEMQARLGLERTIVVQPVTYGFDNRCTLDSVAALGDNARAVVTVPTSISDSELAELWSKGARGLRYHQMRGSLTEWTDLPAMADRIRGTGWHLQIQFEGSEFPDHEDLISRLACTVVIDHMGRYERPLPLEHPAVRSLLKTAARDNVYVKLSGAYHIAHGQGPEYREVVPLAQALIAVGTERLLWGSDWPHPTETAEMMPDDADLIDLLLAWAPDPATQKAILSDNPARLYGFAR